MTDPKLVVVLAAMLFGGSAGTALAQGTGGSRAPSPGIGGGGIGGGGGTFIAPTPGIGTGASPGTGITPTPGIGTGTPCPTLRRRLGSERPRIPQAHSPAGLQAAGLRARGLRATSLRATSLRTSDRPAPSRTSRRKPRQVSPTNHVPLTSDFRTGSRCALVFRDFPLIGRTTRRNSASPAERLALVYWAPLNRE
jgi:hypothetical protein